MKQSVFRVTRRTGVLAVALLASMLVWILFNHSLYRPYAAHLLLRSENPSGELFDEMVGQADDPVNLLQRCWDTGKITHRQLVATFLKNHAAANLPWFKRAEPLVAACTTDADFSVRELGLAAEEACHSRRLFESAQAQLHDPDPLARLLGVDYLRKADLKRSVPLLIHLLDDPDLRVVAAAELDLMRLSGEDYGVRARLAIPSQEGDHPGQIDSANEARIHDGVMKRKEWWRLHQQEYCSTTGSLTQGAQMHFSEPSRAPVADFRLPDLAGKRISLSEFRGKVVLLNFWATWCPACLAEIPELVALQKKLGDRVAIIGVALDGVPDEDGDIPVEEEAGEKSPKGRVTRRALRAKVERAVKARRINYPVLLDPTGFVGGRYNGHELPTTVIIDAEGRVRRRFIGERNLAVLESMIAEASMPLLATHLPRATKGANFRQRFPIPISIE
jgi:thiol-disulfide isomerase/thioredoxin